MNLIVIFVHVKWTGRCLGLEENASVLVSVLRVSASVLVLVLKVGVLVLVSVLPLLSWSHHWGIYDGVFTVTLFTTQATPARYVWLAIILRAPFTAHRRQFESSSDSLSSDLNLPYGRINAHGTHCEHKSFKRSLNQNS